MEGRGRTNYNDNNNSVINLLFLGHNWTQISLLLNLKLGGRKFIACLIDKERGEAITIREQAALTRTSLLCLLLVVDSWAVHTDKSQTHRKGRGNLTHTDEQTCS